MEVTREQQEQLEKVAGALQGLYGVGRTIAAPFSGAAKLALKGAGAAGRGAANVGMGIGNVIGGTIDRAIMPLVYGGAKLGGKAAAGAGATIAGVGSRAAETLGTGAAQVAKGYGNILAKKPVATTLVTGAGLYGGNQLLNKYKKMPYTTSPENLQNYAYMKQRFQKMGSEMKKEAGLGSLVQKSMNYGGTAPSLLGLGALAAIPLAFSSVASPTLSGMGDYLKRKTFSVDERIKSDEEVAKKQIGIAASHFMDKALDKHSLLSHKSKDYPAMESNLQYMIDNDPIVADYVASDESKIEQLRDVMDSVYGIAPDIATNKPATQSILREAAMSPDGGLHYNTVKLIAEAQKAITQGK